MGAETKGKILMVLNEHYPSDIRVLKETRALIPSGYDITLLCLRRKDEKQEERVDDIHVIRVDGGNVKWKKGIFDILIAVFKIHPVFRSKIKEIVSAEKFDLIHVHDLPLFFTAKSAGKKYVKNILIDFHENYPDALSVWFKWRKNLIIRLKNNLFFNYPRWKKFESLAAQGADYVVAVVEEMKERLVAQADVPEDKITIVSNVEGKDFLDQTVDPEIFKEYEGKFIISYTGNVGPHRGVDTLIKSMAYLKEFDDILLLVIGNCSDDNRQYLESLVEENQLHGKVELWGYRPFHQFYSFMSMSDVNVIPHNKSGHTDHTVPHKLFQAMMVAKPVLVSSCKPLKRIVEKYQCGLVFEAENPKDASEQIIKLYKDKEQYDTMAQNGYAATIDGDLNWEYEGKALIALYDKILDS